MKRIILFTIFIILFSGCSKREYAPCPINEFKNPFTIQFLDF